MKINYIFRVEKFWNNFKNHFLVKEDLQTIGKKRKNCNEDQLKNQNQRTLIIKNKNQENLNVYRLYYNFKQYFNIKLLSYSLYKVV